MLYFNLLTQSAIESIWRQRPLMAHAFAKLSSAGLLCVHCCGLRVF